MTRYRNLVRARLCYGVSLTEQGRDCVNSFTIAGEYVVLLRSAREMIVYCNMLTSHADEMPMR